MKIEHLLGERRSRARRQASRDAAVSTTSGAGAFDNMVGTLARAKSAPEVAPGNTMANAPVSVSNKARPDNANLKVIPGGKDTTAPAAPAVDTTAPVAPAVDTTAPAAPAANPATSGPTGDPTLDQPLAPSTGSKRSLTQMGARALGGLSKAVGGIASIPQGVGRAMKKGYQAGVQNIGGPGSAIANAAGYQSVPSMPAAGVGRSAQADQAGQAEIDDLKRTLGNLDRRLRAAGLEETGQSKKR